MGPQFVTDFEPRHGDLIEVSPLLRRIVCNNPSKYTFHGTGTYVIGRGDVAVVDPGDASIVLVSTAIVLADGSSADRLI